MADVGLNHEPLILALVDAKVRADEEYERAYDRANRPEGAELHPREEERLRRLVRRSDALNAAYFSIQDHDPGIYTEQRDDALEHLGELKREAAEAFELYKLEVGLRDSSEADE